MNGMPGQSRREIDPDVRRTSSLPGRGNVHKAGKAIKPYAAASSSRLEEEDDFPEHKADMAAVMESVLTGRTGPVMQEKMISLKAGLQLIGIQNGARSPLSTESSPAAGPGSASSTDVTPSSQDGHFGHFPDSCDARDENDKGSPGTTSSEFLRAGSSDRYGFNMEALRAHRPEFTPVGSPDVSPIASPRSAISRLGSSDSLSRTRSSEAVKGGANDFVAASALADGTALDMYSITQGWVRKFHEMQSEELRPWVKCDSSQEHTYVSVSIKGARMDNEDAVYCDGRFFGVFDGHSGSTASTLCRVKLADNFYQCLNRGQTTSSHPNCIKNPPPLVVEALHTAFAETQNSMPTAPPENKTGCTAITSWLHHDAGSGPSGDTALKVFSACCGDSQAVMFDSLSGDIPEERCRLWDHEMHTLYSAGEDAILPYETAPHGITGNVLRNESGKAVAMENDDTGVGFREYELLRRKHKLPASKLPRCISNMPGEFRWRLFDLEPTRALGHRCKKLGPLTSPEIYEWHVDAPEQTMLLLCCDGFFSKKAFASPQMLTYFLVDPRSYCQRPDFFTGTCFESLLQDLREPLPTPANKSMGTLFKFIYKSVNQKLCDQVWRDAHDSAYQFLSIFAQEKPTPNIRTAPGKTLLAACYLASLMVSDDNISCTLVLLDQHKLYGEDVVFELGVEHNAPNAASTEEIQTEARTPSVQKRLGPILRRRSSSQEKQGPAQRENRDSYGVSSGGAPR